MSREESKAISVHPVDPASSLASPVRADSVAA